MLYGLSWRADSSRTGAPTRSAYESNRPHDLNNQVHECHRTKTQATIALSCDSKRTVNDQKSGQNIPVKCCISWGKIVMEKTDIGWNCLSKRPTPHPHPRYIDNIFVWGILSKRDYINQSILSIVSSRSVLNKSETSKLWIPLHLLYGQKTRYA